MKLYIDLSTQRLITAPGYSTPVSELSVKRGDMLDVELYFFTDSNQPAVLPSGAAIVFAAKPADAYANNAALVVYSDEWTAPASGQYAYAGSVNLNTTELNALLGLGEAGTPLKSVTLMGELSWSVGTSQRSTQTFKLTVANDVYRGSEADPSEADPTYPPASSVLTTADIGVKVAAPGETGGTGDGSGSAIELHPRGAGSAYFLGGNAEGVVFARSEKAIFVADGAGNLLRSVDGESFGRFLPGGVSGLYFMVAAQGEKIVALGTGIQAYSADGGLTWTTASQSIPCPEFTYNGLLAANPSGEFVIAYGSDILRSETLGTWAIVTGHGFTSLIGAAYFAGYWWFINSDENTVHKTADFSAWESIPISPTFGAPSGFGVGPDRLIVALYGTHYLSIGAADTAWTAVQISDGAETTWPCINSIRWMDGKFWFVGYSNLLACSSDGTDFEIIPWGEAGASLLARNSNDPLLKIWDITKAASGWGYLLGTSNGIAMLPVHPELVPANQVAKPVPNKAPVLTASVGEFYARALEYDPIAGQYLLAGDNASSAGVLYTSFDLRTWTLNGAAPAERIYALSQVPGGGLYAACAGKIYRRAAGESIFTAVDSINTPAINYTAIKAVRTHATLAAGEMFVAVGTGGNVTYKGNGAATFTVAANSGTTGNLSAVAYGNGRWVIGGLSTSAGTFIAVSDDLETWTPITVAPVGASGACSKLEYDPEWGFVALIGDGGIYHSFDGLHWSGLAGVTASGFVLGGGRLYIHAASDPAPELFFYDRVAQLAYPIASGFSVSTYPGMFGVVREGRIVASILNGTAAEVRTYFLNPIDPAQVGTFGVALLGYTADDESAAYTAATTAELNALRVAYENLRVAFEDLRTKLIDSGVVS